VTVSVTDGAVLSSTVLGTSVTGELPVLEKEFGLVEEHLALDGGMAESAPGSIPWTASSRASLAVIALEITTALLTATLLARLRRRASVAGRCRRQRRFRKAGRPG
jgi:hypothetical protein